MADYFTNFSFIHPLKEDREYALNLFTNACSGRWDQEALPADFPAALKEVLEDWHFELETCDAGLWLHSQSGGIDAVCAFVQHLLQKFNSSECVTFQWSDDCSQPRTNAYGGGAAIITTSEIKTMNTSDWLSENVPKTTKHENHHCPPG